MSRACRTGCILTDTTPLRVSTPLSQSCTISVRTRHFAASHLSGNITTRVQTVDFEIVLRLVIVGPARAAGYRRRAWRVSEVK